MKRWILMDREVVAFVEQKEACMMHLSSPSVQDGGDAGVQHALTGCWCGVGGGGRDQD